MSVNAEFHRALERAVRAEWGEEWVVVTLRTGRDVLDALEQGDAARAEDIIQDARGTALLRLALADVGNSGIVP